MFNYNMKALLANIATMHASRAKANIRLHFLACHAVWLAATPDGGRIDAIQAIHNGLSEAERDMFRAWLGPTANTFGVDTSVKWLAYKDGQYSLVGGAVKHRPTHAAVVNVANDFALFFLNKSAKQGGNEAEWSDVVERKIGALIADLKKNATTAGVPALIQDAETLKTNILAFNIKAKTASIPATADVPAPVVPIVQSAPVAPKASKKYRPAARSLKELAGAIEQLPAVNAA